jgi:hypothetical protein
VGESLKSPLGRSSEGSRHDKTELNAILRDHGVDG